MNQLTKEDRFYPGKNPRKEKKPGERGGRFSRGTVLKEFSNRGGKVGFGRNPFHITLKRKGSALGARRGTMKGFTFSQKGRKKTREEKRRAVFYNVKGSHSRKKGT